MNGSQLMSKKRLEIFKRFTMDLSSLSKCTDKKNACVITDAIGSQVYAIGINGGARGGHDCLCNLDSSRYTCVHAEANALAKCTSTDQDKCIICTQAPCVTCAALMVNNGVKQVYYTSKYKSTVGIDILKDAGVHVEDISRESLEPTWTERLIDTLNAQGFVFITSNSAAGRWNAEVEQALVEAGKKRGYATTLATHANGISIEWSDLPNG